MNDQKGVKSFLSTLFYPLKATIEFLQNNYKGIVVLLILLLIAGILSKERQEANLITIYLKGTILDPQPVLRQIDEAMNRRYKGVLFVIDSPGGAVAPSIEISQAIKRLAAKKPVVAYAAGTMASGSYYSAIWAKKIYANPGSLVGSIGVIFEVPVIKGVLDKVGISPEVVKMGKYKEVGTPFRPWKDFEKEEIKKVIASTYDMFVKDVCKARGLRYEDKEKFADAHIFTAAQAKKVGLIDEVGTIYEAKKAVQTLAKVKHPRWKKPTPIEQLMDRLAQKSASYLASFLWGMKLF